VSADVSEKHCSATIFSEGMPCAVKMYFRARTTSYEATRLFIAQEHDKNCSVFVTGKLEVAHNAIFVLHVCMNNTVLLGIRHCSPLLRVHRLTQQLLSRRFAVKFCPSRIWVYKWPTVKVYTSTCSQNPDSNPPKSARSHHDRIADCVFAQQYSSVILL
jgi:hypothetical protein